MLVFDKLNFNWQPVCRSGTCSIFRYVFHRLNIDANNVDIDRTRFNIMEKHYCSPERFFNKIVKERNRDLQPNFTFAFVRNPWHRAASAYNYVKNVKHLMHRTFAGNVHRNLMYHLAGGDHMTFESFVDYIVNIERNHAERVHDLWRCQATVMEIHGRYPVRYDYVGRVEDMKNNFAHVSRMISNENYIIPHIHPSSAEARLLFNDNAEGTYNYKEYYTSTKLIDTVGDYYIRDLETFGYRWDG